MSRFFGELLGDGGLTTQWGNAYSGISVSMRSPDVGVRVYMRTNSDGQDEVVVFRTGGSNNQAGEVVARFTSQKK